MHSRRNGTWVSAESLAVVLGISTSRLLELATKHLGARHNHHEFCMSWGRLYPNAAVGLFDLSNSNFSLFCCLQGDLKLLMLSEAGMNAYFWSVEQEVCFWDFFF